ncbi:hypothetical protein [Bartonella choladocola]|uniref:Uncharacterized protein n=1 Tax=Bartonella choladocola TaxID=2750995 RepID=A0A1U9MKK2_9HYPH|nr:hypothetical protein [Bartonella choladocola]AQT48260.1 hypothetical protein BBC0122_021790 [Bartonella choladocola]
MKDIQYVYVPDMCEFYEYGSFRNWIGRAFYRAASILTLSNNTTDTSLTKYNFKNKTNGDYITTYRECVFADQNRDGVTLGSIAGTATKIIREAIGAIRLKFVAELG